MEVGEEVDAVAVAAAQLQIEEAEPNPEPEPEPEPEPGPEPEECALCLNDLPLPGEEGAVLLVCTHAFHTGCLERWKDKCPEKGLPLTCAMCRRTVLVAAAEETEET